MNFGSAAPGGGSDSGSGANAGPDLAQIETEQLAFQSAAGEDKVKLLPSAWPTDNLPATTASLLSVASGKGLIAAAGPETLVVTSTDSVRHTFLNEFANAETKVKSYTPTVSMNVPRVSQVMFSSDESCLVIAAEQGGGLAVYDANGFVDRNTEVAFQMPTEGESVRQLLPNPNPAADLSRYFGVVTENGKLLLADLKERKLVTGSNGSTVFHDNVSCACWSRLGKQIIAGLADGTAVQLDPSGAVKAQVPEPPQLQGLRNSASTALPVTAIYWIETNDFLLIHTPINPPDSGADDDSIYHLAHRNDKASTSWTFNKFTDPCPPFGMVERRPAHHFIQRLRDWVNLTDMLVLASTAGADVGIFTKSKEPLSPQEPVTETFTYTQTPDQRRAAMPFGVDGSDTSAIGMALDLSTKEKIYRPIPNDETLDESPIPLPALYVLDNEGMLSMWWIIYNEGIRSGQAYPDLIAAGGPRSLEAQRPMATSDHAHPSSPTTQPPSSFGSFGASSTTPAQATPAFGQPRPPSQGASTPAFGQPRPPSQGAPAPAFGQSSFGAPNTPAFGGTSSIGNRQSPWGAPSSVATAGGAQFGKSTFGQPSAFGASAGPSAFGQVGGMGANKGSIWGTPSQQSTQQNPSATSGGATGSIFGGNANQQSPFMSLGGTKAPSGFAALGGADKENKPSLFAAASQPPGIPAERSGSTVSFGNQSSFGSGNTTFGIQSLNSPTPSATGTGNGTNLFAKASMPASREESMKDDNDTGTEDTASTFKPSASPPHQGSGLFGLGQGGFKLGSTFKGDGTAKDDGPKPKDPGAGLFGKGFGDALGDANDKGQGSGSAAWWSESGSSTPAATVKKETGTEDDGPKLSDIPSAPTDTKEDKNEAAAPPPADEAPLPPDPTTWKPKPGALPPPTPPGFDFGKKEEVPDAPVPQVPSSTNETTDEASGPLAGSPPVDLGQEKFSEGVASSSEAGGPEDEGDWSDEQGEEGDEGEDEGEEEDEEGDEGESGEEETEQGTPDVTDQKGLSAFEARLTPASPKRGENKQAAQDESTTPATDKKSSYTPAGMPKAPVMFAPPQRKGPESPRSPSPIRSATSPLRSLPSLTAQSPLSKPPAFPQQQQSLGSRVASTAQQQPLPTVSRSTSQAQPQPPQRIAVPPAQLVQNQRQRLSAPANPTEPDAGSLEDEEDARIQSILSAPIEPTTDVPSFLAHQDYVASGGEKPGLGGQIERVYRDINSMVDTLALNARSLRGFAEGNMQPHGQEGQKGRLELEDEDGWLLGGARELGGIVQGIEIELEDGRLEDVRGALESLRNEEKELAKLRAKSADVRKRITSRDDPEQLQAALPLETQTLQTELRQEVQRVQKLLAKAEELLSVLRAELASVPSSEAQNGSGVPTVEAVERTIRRMTKMVEERRGDVDVLEAKIRRLGGPSTLNHKLNRDYEDDLAASMKASRLSSPAAAMRISRYGSPMAARRSQRAGTPGTMSSPGFGRKSLFDVSTEEVEAYRVKKDARRAAMERLKEALESRGPRVVKVGDV